MCWNNAFRVIPYSFWNYSKHCDNGGGALITGGSSNG